jgi:hypothetical protein
MHESCETISHEISRLKALRDEIVLILAKPHRNLARPTSNSIPSMVTEMKQCLFEITGKDPIKKNPFLVK